MLDRVAESLARIVCAAQQKDWADRLGFFNSFEASLVALVNIHNQRSQTGSPRDDHTIIRKFVSVDF
jgi:hypothetical protein